MTRTLILGFLLTPISVTAARAADELDLQRFKLANEIRVVIGHVPDAPKQTTFTFLSPTLVTDDASRGQWSHLLEHMILRTTDPNALQVNGIILNGETTHEFLRLETFADKDHWKDALAKHAQWLTAQTFKAATLETEKGRIAEEEKSTAANGATVKFALAAWNQIVNHGVNHATIHGDVVGAKIEDVQRYRESKLSIDQSVLIATIGPASLEDVRREIDRVFGSMPATVKSLTHPASPPTDQTKVNLSGAFTATWDLPARHAMWWWSLPDPRTDTFAAATALAQAIQTLAAMNAELKPLVKRTLVMPMLMVTGDQRVLLIDCELQEATKPDEVWDRLKPLLADLGEKGTRHGMITLIGKNLVSSATPRPDFAAMRTQMTGSNRDLVEGLWLLSMMNLEYAWDIPAQQASASLWNLDQEIVKNLAQRLIDSGPGTLILEPAAK